jgi:hypothetical protein
MDKTDLAGDEEVKDFREERELQTVKESKGRATDRQREQRSWSRRIVLVSTVCVCVCVCVVCVCVCVCVWVGVRKRLCE